MEEEIFEVLQNPKIEEGISVLTNLYGIEAVEAASLIAEFQELEFKETTVSRKDFMNLIDKKWEIINKILSKNREKSYARR